jgi:hypothetical protein
MATPRGSSDEHAPLQLGQHSTGPATDAAGAAHGLSHLQLEDVQLHSGGSYRMEEGRHPSHVDVADLHKLRRLTSEHTLHEYSKQPRKDPG